MKAVALKFREKKFRSFYRMCILPAIIPNRKGEVKKLFITELEEHKAMVTENGLNAEFKAYKRARDLRQHTYDAMVVAQRLVETEPSEKNGTASEKARADFESAKFAFVSAYQ